MKNSKLYAFKKSPRQDQELTENSLSCLAKKLQEIGGELRRIRTEKEISLDDIVAETHIAHSILVAIEQGKIKELPEPFYTKALIKKYAHAIGVEAVPDYTEIEDLTEETAVSESQNKFKGKLGLNRFQLRSQHLYLLYLVLVGLAVKGITMIVDSSQTNNNLVFTETDISNNSGSSVINSSSSTNGVTTTSSQLVTQSNTSNSDSVIVDVTLKDRCWMKIMVDGKVEFEGILLAGTNRTWKGKEEVTIVAGNAGGVVVTYNHGQGKLLGKPGQVQEVTYTVN